VKRKKKKTIEQGSTNSQSVEIKSDEFKVTQNLSFPIVGIGASAGGLEALKAFCSAVSPESGNAYIIVMHLSPDQPSIMDELLQRETEIPVTTAQDGDSIVPNHIYTIPPNRILTVYQGKIQIFENTQNEKNKPIDQLFQSLAVDQGKMAAAIILSGTGSDGSLGAKYIKEYGGIVVAQSEETAQYYGMPGSVINLGIVDLILAPREVPQQLKKYYSHLIDGHKDVLNTKQERWLNKILSILRRQIGHDFYAYKKKTIVRRIEKRMSLHQIKNYDEYIHFLRENKKEIETLFRELLIGVTYFFRDPKSFESIKKSVLPSLFKNMENDEYLRVWVPGCSTGEEVYSLAMIIQEAIDLQSRRINLQLFGTDIDEKAIEKARMGLYPASIASDVGDIRLRRFFTQEGDFFRIKKEIRDKVVFSEQNILKDPPFSNLHILVCRNLLIYLESSSQKKLMPLFHYTLKPQGFLMLGSSESIGGFTNLFETIDNKWKIFRRKEVHPSVRSEIEFPTGTAPKNTSPKQDNLTPVSNKEDLGTQVKKLLLERFAPTALLINEKGTILYVQGKTGKFLETATGPPSQNLLDLAREGIRLELSSAIRKAVSTSEKVSCKQMRIRSQEDENKALIVNCYVYPLKEPEKLAGELLIIFEDISYELSDEIEDKTAETHAEKTEDKISELEQELQNNRESHQTITEELESSNEELKSTNEELQSSNEELQSTNEELESSKEEQQSLNEELQTVNSELQNKVNELSSAQDDLRNILNSTEIATVFVDNEMNVRRFTEEATRLFNIIQTDIGRPFKHITHNLDYEQMDKDVEKVLNQLSKVDRKVKTTEGYWYEMRILPYRTTDNRIDGAVLVFQDINSNEEAWELMDSVFNINPQPLVVTDNSGQIIIANTAFLSLMYIDPKKVTDYNLFTLPGISAKFSELKKALKDRSIGYDKERLITQTVDVPGEEEEDFLIRVRIIKMKNQVTERFFIQFLMQEGIH